MKHTAARAMAPLLLVALLIATSPATALAADGERVLTSIRHSAAVAAVNVSNSTTATLSVPHSHPGTVDLAQGLDITYSTSIYSAASPSFPDGSVAEAGGPSVNMVVTYQRKGDAMFYRTTYTLHVVRADYLAPKFAGTISKTASPTRAATFAEADFVEKYTKNDGSVLGSVVITGSNPSFGSLRLGSAVYRPGDSIALASIKSGNLTFVATGTGTVDYIVEACGADTAKTKAEGSVLLRVSAVSVAPTFSGTISKTMTVPATLKFTASDFTGAYAKNDGANLGSISITGSDPNFGKLKLGSSDYVAGTSIPISDVSSGRLTFEATAAGAVSYTVRAYASGDTTTPVGSAKLTITARAAAAAGIDYTVQKNTPFVFDTTDFNRVCAGLTGESLYYVRFTLPPSSYGRLYYDYVSSSDYGSTVSSGTGYYRSSSPYLSRVWFVPGLGYTGQVSITYTGYSTGGQSFAGEVRIKVSAVADNIPYVTSDGIPVTFEATDFAKVCGDATGGALSYVTFQLPSTTYGRLYYGYTSLSNAGSPVLSGTRYYRSSSPSLSEVTFVPRSGYSGVVAIGYTGYTTVGQAYSGTVRVVVRDKDGRSLYFDDVGVGHSWASGAIDYLCEKGIAAGTGPRTYNPSASISRGDFMLMLCRAFELGATVSGNFDDVPSGSYYYDAISIAKALGIATGDGRNFRPAAAISRQDAMVLVARTLAHTSKPVAAGNWDDLAGFLDRGEVADYAVSAVGALVRSRAITGTAGKLNPLGDITRAEMAVILHRVLTIQ